MKTKTKMGIVNILAATLGLSSIIALDLFPLLAAQIFFVFVLLTIISESGILWPEVYT